MIKKIKKNTCDSKICWIYVHIVSDRSEHLRVTPVQLKLFTQVGEIELT